MLTQASGVTLQHLRAGGRNVPLISGPGALGMVGHVLAEDGFQGRLFLVADETAARLFASELEAAFPGAPRLIISGEESNKTLSQVSAIWDWLLTSGVQRRDALVAFGGGVVCDMVGFVAATTLRGIGLINVPTTLLAQVDASIGGKTGFNHLHGKNQIGAFYQPRAVVADTLLFRTLPARAFAAGLAEVTKIAMAMDAPLFAELERVADDLTPNAAAILAPIIARSISLKSAVVERDEREDGERMLLNYGHTVGHAVEAAAGYGGLLHGEAVSIGMRAAAFIAQQMGLLSAEAAARQERLNRRVHLPEYAPENLAPENVLPRLLADKKRVGAAQRWVLATDVGSAEVCDDVPDELVQRAVSLVTGGPS